MRKLLGLMLVPFGAMALFAQESSSARIRPAYVPDELIVSLIEDQMPRINWPGDPAPKGVEELFAAAGVSVVSDRPVSPPEVVEHVFVAKLNAGTRLGEAFRRIQRFEFGPNSAWRLNYEETNGLVWIPEDPPPHASRVFNLSTRAEVHSGHGVTIGGIVIPGDYARPVVIKVRGASLTNYGVEGALSDPLLRLHEGQEVILENDNWGDLPDWEKAAARHLCPAPDDEHEAMIYTLLDPGAYTAIVTGADGQTGVALLEIYFQDDIVVQ